MTSKETSRDDEVAIIGMACTYPKAPDLRTFWQNILNGVDAVSEVPKDRWNSDLFYDPESKDGSKLYSNRGGYLDTYFAFDPAKYGVMPVAVEGGEPDQFLVLKAATDAMLDAGYEKGVGEGANVEFILGRGSYIGVGSMNLIQRTLVVEQTLQIVERVAPHLSKEDLAELRKNFESSLLSFGPETAPAVMPNLSASRVANRLGFMGATYTLDAACASSLLAVDIAVRDLKAGQCELALAGGVHIFNTVPFLSVFCSLGAMSPKGVIRPFDKNADGLVPGEGVGLVVLKRRRDAERDGDRIYAVVKGVGSSSDGKGASLNAPRLEGEVLAIRNAHKMAGVSPSTIGLIEAHGTATTVGDAVEVEALTRVFGKKEEGEARSCALGSVKSMIGHAMPAAGIAGLIKTALALHYKVLPPTLHCEEPHPKFEMDKTPFYVNTGTRPWIHGKRSAPRRAGVNAFGFGGINAHTVLEEVESEIHAEPRLDVPWDTHVFIFCGSSMDGLLAQAQETSRRLKARPDRDLSALSRELAADLEGSSHRLAIVSKTVEDLAEKLDHAIQKLSGKSCKKIKDIRGIYFFSSPLGPEGKIAFLFPGEGSTYSNMMADLCLRFPEVRACFDEVDHVVSSRQKPCRFLPSQFIFPAPLLTDPEREELEGEFWGVDTGLQSILAANFAAETLLGQLAVRPHMILGHSAGEYSAWISAGIIRKEDLFEKQDTLSSLYLEDKEKAETAMMAVSTNREKVEEILKGLGGDIYVSNDNCPHQVVVVGTQVRIEALKAVLKEQGILGEALPSKQAHHTPFSSHHAEPLRKAFSSLRISAPRTPIYSPTIAAVYPDQPEGILDLMVDYWLKPLEFTKTIESMYEDGARVFIEAGAGTNLVAFVDDTLRRKSHLAVSTNNPRKSGLEQFCHLIGLLAAHHVPIRLEDLLKPGAQKAGPPASVSGESGKGKPARQMSLQLGLPEITLPASYRPKEVSIEKAVPEVHVPKAAAQDGPSVQDSPKDVERPLLQATGGSNGRTPKPGTLSSKAMKGYLEIMEEFLDVQQGVMDAYLLKRRAGPREQEGGGSSHKRLPFIGEILAMEPGKRCTVRRRIRLQEDRFLYDHPFGGNVSAEDSELYPLIVVPLTIGMEIMTEAASLLFPGHVPVGLREVRANRWIEVEEDTPTTLTVEAASVSSGSNEARVRIYVGDREEKSKKPLGGVPAFEATVLFAAGYPDAPPLERIGSGEEGGPSSHSAEEIYREKYMTHGRRFQVITALVALSEDRIVSHLRVPAEDDLFTSNPAPNLLASPIVLDACAQSVGYWAQKHLKKEFISFPIGPREIRFHSPPPKPGDKLECRARIRKPDSEFIEANVEMIHPNGRPWLTIEGWRHRRFQLPLDLYDFWRFPEKEILSKPWNGGGLDGAGPDKVACFRVGLYPEIDNTIWKKSIAYLYLNHGERKVYRDKVAGTDKGNPWLAGRIAAKDAARTLLAGKRKGPRFPADIEIQDGTNGTPARAGGRTGTDEEALTLSVAHAKGFAVAAVADSERVSCLGTVVRPLMEDKGESGGGAFADVEFRLLETIQPTSRQEWMTRFLCAKEAASQALSRETACGPEDFVISTINLESGGIQLETSGKRFGAKEKCSLIAFTHREGNDIFAACFKERS